MITVQTKPAHHTARDRKAEGAGLRKVVPRGDHAVWQAPPNRRDPVHILQAQGVSRIARLLPMRYERMQASAFTFLRGAAAIMAEDLASTPCSGLLVQACGDCHLANFGAYASPEGLPVFDVNDFDETLPAPFEWDVKRLATSLVLASRDRGMPKDACEGLAFTAVQAYAEALRHLAAMAPNAAWSTRVDLAAAVAAVAKARVRAQEHRRLKSALDGSKAAYGLAVQEGGRWRIRDKPPAIFRLDPGEEAAVRSLFHTFANSLLPERRVLLDRYQLQDVAFKVVGIGSVGTLCAVGLFTNPDGHPLMLQVKEAQASVLAPFTGASHFANQGERVVVGQRMLQAASDIFLGWAKPGPDGRNFYVRTLKDSRLAAIGTTMESGLGFYSDLCGRTLARAHARTGDAAAISGYIGGGPGFGKAIAAFAEVYAEQSEQDWRRLRDAIKQGVLPAAPA